MTRRSNPMARHVPGLIAMLFGLAAALPGYGIEVARMKLPPEFAEAADRWRASGFGGKNRGQYELGDYRGEFTRTESRFAVFDPFYAKRRGRSSFTLTGPGIERAVSAACEFSQKSMTIGVVTFDPNRMVYSCSLSREGEALPGELLLGEPRPDDTRSRVLAMSVRKGELRLGDQVVGIASVHDYAGSKVLAPMPVGYLFTRGEDVVGALELTDSQPSVLLRRELDAGIREAVLVAALSVAVLRDPAHSALGGPDD